MMTFGLFLATFMIAAGFAPFLIARLRRLSYQQHAYELAPETHQAKTGTPTMGGLLFLLPLFTAPLVARDPTTWPYVFLIAGCAAIGFIDDYLSVRRGRNRGLRARTKFLGTLLVGVFFLGMLSAFERYAVPSLFGFGEVPYWFWYGLSLLVILATTHAVNLTDGLDGLVTGTFLSPLIVLAFITWREHLIGATAIQVAMAGACVAFLLFNKYPARVFMGDTGSLALGGVLAGAAILGGVQLLLPLVGGVFAIEALSVILQVAYYKATKKRIFRMSPLHHHFELGGWPETKVTARFWLVSFILACAGLGLAFLSVRS